MGDAPDPETLEADAKSVTIVINDNGEINYDEKTLQSIIDSNQPSATVTFVRVSGTEEGNSPSTSTTNAGSPEENLEAAAAADPILLLDQEQINRLENVLRSEEAKDILGDVLSNAANNPNESLGDFLTPTEEAVVSGLLPHTGSATAEMAGKFENLTTETNPKAAATRKTRQTRTSQRQLDRELKEEAERIRKENQLLLKKEKEAMKKQSLGQSKIESDELVTPDDSIDNPENNQDQTQSSPTKATVTPTTASGRPKRERKLPAHLKAGDFEY